MVVDSSPADEQTDRLFQALADATRRDIVGRTLGSEHSVTQLARYYPMSFAAVQKHVAVLERAGLVTKRKDGRQQLVAASGEVLHRAVVALEQLETQWRQRIARIDQLLDDRPS